MCMRIRLPVVGIKVYVNRCRAIRIKHAPLLLHTGAAFNPRVRITGHVRNASNFKCIAIGGMRLKVERLRIAQQR